MILLDTNALIWIHQNSRRSAVLLAQRQRLYASPACVLELQILIEAGRLRLRRGHTVASIIDDDRWVVDDPPSAEWFDRASRESWTRDPFDRLLVARARLRGWRVATGDGPILDRLAPSERFDL